MGRGTLPGMRAGYTIGELAWFSCDVSVLAMREPETVGSVAGPPGLPEPAILRPAGFTWSSQCR